MMLARILPPVVAKEVRALLPLWLGTLAALVCVPALARRIGVGDGSIQVWGLLIYGGASATLGALSIGHEYSNRTLPLLLSQPASRARVFVVKQFVLAMMLLILAVVAWIYVLFPGSGMVVVVVLVALGGLFVTPWLTMLSRNPLAGAVFTGPIPSAIWLLVDAFVARPMRLAVFEWATLGCCAVAAVLGWRAFIRLEAIEGPGASLRWPAVGAALVAAGRTRHPIWLLVKKEIALQHLSLAVAVIYLLGLAAVSLLGPIAPRLEDTVGSVSALYGGLLALLIGSLASAEERHIGTLEWQRLLPMDSWKQWVVKAGTALGLALLLAVGLPLISSHEPASLQNSLGWYVCAIVMVTTASLYVSSLSSSGIRALLVAVPVSFLLIASTAYLTGRRTPLSPLPVLLFAGVVTVALYLAWLNHRSSERSAGRLGLQVGVMAGCLALAAALASLAR